MLTTIEIAKVTYLLGVKVITKSALVGGGMVAGTIAACCIAQIGLPNDYSESPSLMLNKAIEAEYVTGPGQTVRPSYSGESLAVVRDDFDRGSVFYLQPPQDETKIHPEDYILPIPRITVTGKRMNINQQGTYDSERLLQPIAQK